MKIEKDLSLWEFCVSSEAGVRKRSLTRRRAHREKTLSGFEMKVEKDLFLRDLCVSSDPWERPWE
jgi:hypothetical protein